MSEPRWVVVGHADSGIQYTGSWTTNDGTNYDSQGNFGTTHRGLNGATGVANLSYVFNGSLGRIMGTNNIKNSSGVLDPVWECFIDGVSIGLGNATIFPYIENNWQLCKWYSLTPGQHTIAVNVNSQSQAFFFDRFEYQPSVQVDSAEILISHLDSDIQYDSNWQKLGTTSYITQKTGATVTFPFVGTGLSWYGMVPNQFSHQGTTATYSIDGGSPVTFSVSGLPNANSATQYNRKFFETPTLSVGSHNLTVTLTQGGSVSPLVLDYLIIDSGSTALLGTGSSVSSGTPTASGSTSTTASTTSVNSPDTLLPGVSKGNTPVGAIVGGVIGAIALLLLLLWIFCYRKRRRQGIALVASEAHKVRPFVIPEDQNPNPVLLPTSLAPQQSSSATTMSKNVPRTITTPESNYRPSGAVGKHEAISHRTPAPVLVSNPHQITSTATITNSASDSSGSMAGSSSGVVIHQDSGIRLPQQGPDVVEYPPMYTPG